MFELPLEAQAMANGELSEAINKRRQARAAAHTQEALLQAALASGEDEKSPERDDLSV